MQMEEVEA